MGLDAIVFCDCIEKKRLKVLHPLPKQLYIAPNGSPQIRSNDLHKIEQHDEWMEVPPCNHEFMQADGAELGNATHIQMVRNALAAVLDDPRRSKCPILMKRVLYSGTHTGDHLTVKQVQRLADELQSLQKADLSNSSMLLEEANGVNATLKAIRRLSNVPLKLNKPIAF